MTETNNDKPVKVIKLDTGETYTQTIEEFGNDLKATIDSIPKGKETNDYQDGDIETKDGSTLDYNKMVENMVSYYNNWERGGNRRQGLEILIEEYSHILEYHDSAEKTKCVEIAKRKLANDGGVTN